MHQLKLINIFGDDKPAITSAVTAVLARFDANILDIGQAVIHNQLSLGLLVDFSHSESADQACTAVESAMTGHAMRVRFNTIDAQSYHDWVALQGKPRYIVTLLSRYITAEQIAVLTDAVAQHGLNIDHISRLSGRVALTQAKNQPHTKACVEFSARGEPSDALSLRRAFTDIASNLNVDIGFQRDSMYRRTRRLVCFDMDSTLIEAEVIDELAKAAGVGEQVSQITESAMRGEIDFKESFIQRMALLKGLDESVLQNIAKQLPITEGAEHLILSLKKLGYKTAILSGGFSYFGRYLQDKLGIDYVYANELDIKNGKVTGEVHTDIVDGERKAYLLQQLAHQEGISLEQVVAVGDGANDLPMLSVAGLGIAFRAKPLVKAEAEQAISTLGLDAVLYLMGFRDRELENT